MLQTPLSQVTTLITGCITGWAMLRGGRPERIGGVAIALDWAAGVLLQDHRHGHHGQPAVFAADLAMTAVLLGLVLKTRRTWVLWAAACSVLLILTHITLLIDVQFAQWTFQTASYIWGLGVVAALAAGMAVEAGPRSGSGRSAAVRGLGRSTPNARARTRS